MDGAAQQHREGARERDDGQEAAKLRGEVGGGGRRWEGGMVVDQATTVEEDVAGPAGHVLGGAHVVVSLSCKDSTMFVCVIDVLGLFVRLTEEEMEEKDDRLDARLGNLEVNCGLYVFNMIPCLAEPNYVLDLEVLENLARYPDRKVMDSPGICWAPEPGGLG